MKRSAIKGKRIAVLGVLSAAGERGGAEALYEGLVNALRTRVQSVEFITHPADESTYESILANYDYWAKLDLSAFDLVISTKAPTYAVVHPNHIVYLVHTVRAYYDMFDTAFPEPTALRYQQRKLIHRLDTQALKRARHIFCIGDEVGRRLRKWNNLDGETLHPPLLANHFRPGKAQDYFLVVGRLHPWKRVDLAIEAFQRTDLEADLKIVGVGEAEGRLRKLAGDDDRIHFLGRVSDDELIELYSECLAVVFIPRLEDYGYISLEAFNSGKPVITCTDSGEPLQFVKDNRTGKVAEPKAASIAQAMEELWGDKNQAAKLGRQGRKQVAYINWGEVADRLLDSGFAATNSSAQISEAPKLRAAVLDMQPIEPPIGGGRLRLLGLYHDLHGLFTTRYIGSYDWPGEKRREIWHSETLTETTVPLSSEHHNAAARLSREMNGKTVIDLAFARFGHLSREYLEAAVDAAIWADVVIFSHPWVYPLVSRYLRPDQLVVYDSHNVEGYLRAQLLDRDQELEYELLTEVIEAEYGALRAADLVLACSQEDIEQFVSIYEIDPIKFRLAPNGVMVTRLHPVAESRKAKIRKERGIGCGALCAIFIGSSYGPNVDAARFIMDEIASALPDIEFIIAGGVGDAFGLSTKDNVLLTGQLSEEEKSDWLGVADIAINPMFGGSGTNIKMFDFFAAGLPTLTTPMGGRGIPLIDPTPYLQAERREFVEKLRELAANGELRQSLAADSRHFVEQHYSWERISRRAGKLLARSYRTKTAEPFFSVIVPTYERHKELASLLEALERQTLQEFEVIVVDQSRQQMDASGYELDIEYCHTSVRGAIHARNYGASLATAEYLAFIDDDCVPDDRWLETAKMHINACADDIVGLEGEIVCPETDRSRFRVVTNVGSTGLYMTANLFVSARGFRLTGGFDMIFDNPHFREDTDLGWRLESLGKIKRVVNVAVTHPAQPKTQDRDSDETRDRFFEKDALLYKKHPEKFKELFLYEQHYKNTPGYWPNFLIGVENFGVTLDEFFEKYRPSD